MTYGVPPEDEVRYRVVEVFHVDEGGSVMTGDIREFKTRQGAYDFRNGQMRLGRSLAVQVGQLHWLADGEEAAPASAAPEGDTATRTPAG